jgi:exonuclease III
MPSHLTETEVIKMAWRPTEYLVQGELDNTTLGKVTGWMKFAGKGRVTFDLKGDFHRDIRGAKIHFKGGASGDEPGAEGYMEGFSSHQTGNVGDITAGLPPTDYVSYPYIEWYGDNNGRVVIELEPGQVEVIGTAIPACESDPISRGEQNRNMDKFLGGLAKEMNIPTENAVCIGGTTLIKAENQNQKTSKTPGMKLLTEEIRKQLPPLYSQDSLGGKAVAYVKFFTPDSNWTWWATEGGPVKNDDGEEIDFHFFGLVEGFEKELGYFSLSELETARGPMGLPIERDLYWQPKTLEEIAPEMFEDTGNGGD